MRGLKRNLRTFSHGQGKSGAKPIHLAEEFGDLLERERARADRTGGEFSLLIFDRKDLYIDQARTQRLLDLITRRVRLTDEVGWFDMKRIGVLLTGTTFYSAMKLGEEICEKAAGEKQLLVFRTFTYPSAWSNGSKTNPGGGGPRKESHYEEGTQNMGRKLTKMEYSEKGALELCGILARPLPTWKRCIDIVGSVFGLILLFPLIVFLSALIKFLSPGPAFFKQERIGFLGRPFNIYKFRTMSTKSDPSLHENHLSHIIHCGEVLKKLDDESDPRIIPLGKFLRRSGLDELPQLVNVLRGDMSLIGPRPCLQYEARQYSPWQERRWEVMPGITGLWQVSGKNRTTHAEMMRLDIRYVQEKSFFLDMKILLKTVPAVLGQITANHLNIKERKYVQSS